MTVTNDPAHSQPTTPLALPAPSEASTDTSASTLYLNEGVSTAKFDALGPLVVNSDGVRQESALSFCIILRVD